MTITGENTSIKCLQCINVLNMIIHKESYSCEKMWLCTYFLQKYLLLSKFSTDLHINAIVMVISQKSI